MGVAPLVAGTLLVTAIAGVVGAPLGLGAACYLSEFASAAQRRSIVPVVELRAGIPSVVLGYFALLFLTPLLRSVLPGVDLFDPLSAGIVMGFMILPTNSSISVDAMQALPRSLREAGYGPGAAKHQLVLRGVIPAALSGIVASLILAVSRAIGETMIVTLAAGQRPDLHFDPRKTIATMTSYVVQAATGDQPAGSIGAVGPHLARDASAEPLESHVEVAVARRQLASRRATRGRAPGPGRADDDGRADALRLAYSMNGELIS